MAYKSGDYASAVSWLQLGCDLVSSAPREVRVVMQPTLLALAHAHRKLGDFGEAEVWYNESLRLTPRCAPALAALAYTYQLAGRPSAAVETYHKALALRPDDTFAQTMLRQCLADALVDGIAAMGLGEEEERLPGEEAHGSDDIAMSEGAALHRGLEGDEEARAIAAIGAAFGVE